VVKLGLQQWWTIPIALTAIGVGALSAVALTAQDGGGRNGGRQGGRQGGPPPEMLKACVNKSYGDVCTATGPKGRSISGTCFAPQGRPLACRPQNAGPNNPVGGPTPSEQGEAMLSTQADTSAILCSIGYTAINKALGLESNAKWACAGDYRVLTSNGIPNHETGTFEPGTAGRCPPEVGGKDQCDLGRGSGPWEIEALGQESFNFGDDMNHAHVQPTGEYHYHGVPSALLPAGAKSGQEMMLIGWASDGFPIYALYGRSDPKSGSSPLRLMKTSYQLKAKPANGRPSVDLIPMGAFTQDYEFINGSGDLDECNGRFDITPGFPGGIYHYYATDHFPYVQRCVKGTPSHNTMRLPSGRRTGRP
jgi:YHYH protein